MAISCALNRSGGRWWRCRPLVLFAVLLSMVGLVQAVTIAVSPHGSRALASAATGTGGVFVPEQGRILDTRPAYKIGGYSTPMSPGVWRTVPVAGATMADGTTLPGSGIGAVQVTATVLAPNGVGSLELSQDLSTPKPQTVLTYGYLPGNDSNTAIVPVDSNGKIEVEASTADDVLIDVQGCAPRGAGE